MAGHHGDVSAMDAKALQAIPGVGASIAEKIVEFLQTGSVAAIEKLRAKIPAGVRAMTVVPGLGPRKAMVLYEQLGIDSVAGLEEAIAEGRLAGLRGFGAKTAENLLHGIQLARAQTGRVQIDTAMSVAEEIVDALSAVPGCLRCTYAGSLRRMRETIGDVDILAAAENPRPLMAAFAELPLVAEVIVRGDKKTSVRTTGGPAGRPPGGAARVVGRGAAVLHRLQAAQRTGPGDRRPKGTEALRVRPVPGRRRRPGRVGDRGGGLRAARPGLDPADAAGGPGRGRRGAERHAAGPGHRRGHPGRPAHAHRRSPTECPHWRRCSPRHASRGLKYYAVTDHAKNLPMQRMTDAKMLAQREQIRALAGGKMTVLHGTELNIDPDGEVDWDADFLSGFDVCVASVHSHFTQSAAEMTRRFVRACENPYVHIIGHPTTRQIGRRAPVEADWDAVFAAAGRTGTAMEINSYPDRLDLPDDLILRAKRHGVKFAINTDTHSTVHLGHLRFGVAQAQRAWLTVDDVITAWPLTKLRAFLRAKRRA